MPRSFTIGVFISIVVLAGFLFANPSSKLETTKPIDNKDFFDNKNHTANQYSISSSKTGVMNPLLIEHTASAPQSQDQIARTDVSKISNKEVFVPAGASGDYYSADCSGGYFQVGDSGLEDFSSSSGTISWWGKWDTTNPNGRFWGQDDNFETRWSGNRFILDFGGSNSLVGDKSDWQSNHWYFIAITWNETSDRLGIYWGDESLEPSEDISTTSWYGNIVGRLTRNCVMNSEMKSAAVDGHINDFRYYTVERSLEEIRSDYQEILTGSEFGLSHYYKFENGLLDSANSENLIAVGSYHFSKDVPSIPKGWKAEQIEISIDELETLYALNGTFVNGIPGTNEDWSGDGTYYPYGWFARREVVNYRGRQRASYIQDDDTYIVIENEGWWDDGSNSYRHYNDTRIFWYQDVSNEEQNEQFEFSMDYYYKNGPLGTNFENIFKFKFEILDGSSLLWNWTIDVVNLSARQTLFNVDPISVNITDAPTSFRIRIILEITTPSTSVSISETDEDLDGDSTNGMLVSLLVDNIKLVSIEPPSCQSIELTVASLETGHVNISGWEGIGSVLLNYSYWNKSSIPISFSANNSVSFKYSTKICRMIRFYNSSYTKSLENEGVTYNVEYSESVDIKFYTYIESYPEAQHLGFNIYHSKDWENLSIEDPFESDMTLEAISHSDWIELPIGCVNSVGWWIINLEAPNYIDSISTQIQKETWVNNEIFCSNDKIRCNISIRTDEEDPASIEDVEINWYTSSQTIWSSDFRSNFSGHIVQSSERTIGFNNACVGKWSVDVSWCNGTEAAFGKSNFEVHHQLNPFAYTPNIEVDLGENFTASIYLYDKDTGESLLDSSAQVVANWSDYKIVFSPNLAKARWEADFNSSITGSGIYTILINTSMPFYYQNNCTITVQVLSLTVMTLLAEQNIELGLNCSHATKVRYMFLDGTGITDADVTILSWDGPTGGFTYDSFIPISEEPGNYSVVFTASISGTYLITVRGMKDAHRSATTSFYLLVGAMPTELELLNGTSSVITADEEFDLFVRYTNQTSYPINNASYSLESSSQDNDLEFINPINHDQGIYSITIRPQNAGTFYLVLSLNRTNYEPQYASFSLSVLPITSFLKTNTTIETVAIDQTCRVNFTFQDELLVGIENATISVLSSTPSSGINWSIPADLGGGFYYLILNASNEGTFEIIFRATLPRYQNGTTSFTLIATKIPTNLRTTSDSLSGSCCYSDTFVLELIYERTDIPGNISSATFEITEIEGLKYCINETENVYHLVITPSYIGKWSLTIKAVIDLHKNASILFEFQVIEKSTHLVETIPPRSFYFNKSYSFTMLYRTQDFQGIESANLNLSHSPFCLISWKETEDGYYNFSIRSHHLGSYVVYLRFSKYGYEYCDAYFSFNIIEIPTEISEPDILNQYYESRYYNLAFYYNSSLSGGVAGAELVLTRQFYEFMRTVYSNNGWYNITFVPMSGEWNVTAKFSKEGYLEQIVSFPLSVEKIPVSLSLDYSLNDTYTIYSGSELYLELKPITSDNASYISGATIEYVLFDSNAVDSDVIERGYFEEAAGLYKLNITFRDLGLFLLEITIQIEHYQILQERVYINSITNPEAQSIVIITAGVIGALSLFFIITTITLGRRFYISYITQRNMELFDYKGRLADVRNLIGVLVIRQKVGLSAYSRIIKGAFDESLVSSFITAISQFREELPSDKPQWTSIPISEVITAALTNQLICAMVTVGKASERQKIQLESFSVEVGVHYDDAGELIERSMYSAELAEILYNEIDATFETQFDGALMKKYVDIKENPPKNLQPLKEVFTDVDQSQGISPEDIVKKLILLRLGELRSYRILFEAVEEELLVPLITSEILEETS